MSVHRTRAFESLALCGSNPGPDCSLARLHHGDTVRVALFVTPPAVAETLAVDGAATVPATTLNVARTEPSGTVTLAGTEATVTLFDFSATGVPPRAAGALRVTVATEVPLLGTLDGARPIVLTAGLAVTVIVVDRVTEPALTEILGDVTEVTGEVVTVKLALVAPLDTTIVGGTDATAGLLLVTDTVNPPCGAGPVRPTAPSDVVPPTTLGGARASVERAAGLTVRVAFLVVA
jgi:hypothetical protein